MFPALIVTPEAQEPPGGENSIKDLPDAFNVPPKPDARERKNHQREEGGRGGEGGGGFPLETDGDLRPVKCAFATCTRHTSHRLIHRR